MKNNYLLLALCALSSQAMQAAVTEETKQSIPKHIKLHLNSPNSIIETPGGSYTIKIPSEATEPITGKTFAQRFHETVRIGFPLPLTHIMYASDFGIKVTTIDTCSAIRSFATWKENIFAPNTTVIDCKDIDNSIRIAAASFVRSSPTLQGASRIYCVDVTGAIGPSYKGMLATEYKVKCGRAAKDRLVLKNANLIRIALLYEFTKDPRMLHALHVIYHTLHDVSNAGLDREAPSAYAEAQQRLLKTFKKKRK